MAIIETLSNPGLKKRHWDQIKEISGADIDFQKMSIDRIKFLKIEYMLEPVTKVSEVASKEYSIELYLKSMNEEFLKYQEQFEQIEEKSPENDKKLKSILTSLEEQRSNTKTLGSNKNIKPLLEQLQKQSSEISEFIKLVNSKIEEFNQQ